MTNKLKYPILFYDVYLKTFFLEFPNFLIRFIEDITGLKFPNKNNIEVKCNEIPVNRGNEKFKRVDFLIKINKHFYINVELNKSNTEDWKTKGLNYLCKIYFIHNKKGKRYKKFKAFQININCFETKDDPIVVYTLSPTIVGDGITKLRKNNNHNLANFTEDLKIYNFNVYTGNNIYYNIHVGNNSKFVPDYVKWAAFFSLNDFSKTKEIFKGIFSESECEEAMVKINEMKNNSDLLSEAEIQEIYQLGYEGGLYNAKEEGIQEGIQKGRKEGIQKGIQEGKKQGIIENTIDMIKSMLKNKLQYDLISKVSGMSISEIKKIEKTM